MIVRRRLAGQFSDEETDKGEKLWWYRRNSHPEFYGTESELPLNVTDSGFWMGRDFIGTLERRLVDKSDPGPHKDLAVEDDIGYIAPSRHLEFESTDLERARVLLIRLQAFATVMYAAKLFVSLVSLWAVLKALHNWKAYTESAGWTMFGFVIRVTVTVLMTWVPWYYIFFDDEEFPKYMTHSAKIYMAFMINVPLFSLSFMVTPALVSGAMIVIHMMPYTILPYMIAFIGPILSVVSLWPMLSVIGHGSVNWLLLYGALIYVGYACVTSAVALRSLRSMEAMRKLGKRTFANSRTLNPEDEDFPRPEIRTSNYSEFPDSRTSSCRSFDCCPAAPTPSANVIRVSGSVNTYDCCTGDKPPEESTEQMDYSTGRSLKLGRESIVSSSPLAPVCEPRCSQATNTTPNQIASNDMFRASMGSASIVAINSCDVGQFCSGITSDTNAEPNTNNNDDNDKADTNDDLDDKYGDVDAGESRRSSTLAAFQNFASEKILKRGGVVKVFEQSKFSKTTKRETNRNSIEVTELLVQGTLIAELEDRMQGLMRTGFFFAKMLYYIGATLLLTAVIRESADVFEVMINGGSLWGCVLISLVDCFINKLLMQMICVDFLLNGMVKLRLFNGYMSDDRILTDFVSLQGYATLLSHQFKMGMWEEKNENETMPCGGPSPFEVTMPSGTSPLSPKYHRRSTRSKSMPSRRSHATAASLASLSLQLSQQLEKLEWQGVENGEVVDVKRQNSSQLLGGPRQSRRGRQSVCSSRHSRGRQSVSLGTNLGTKRTTRHSVCSSAGGSSRSFMGPSAASQRSLQTIN
jgi:hypothetical protein